MIDKKMWITYPKNEDDKKYPPKKQKVQINVYQLIIRLLNCNITTKDEPFNTRKKLCTFLSVDRQQ